MQFFDPRLFGFDKTLSFYKIIPTKPLFAILLFLALIKFIINIVIIVINIAIILYNFRIILLYFVYNVDKRIFERYIYYAVIIKIKAAERTFFT